MQQIKDRRADDRPHLTILHDQLDEVEVTGEKLVPGIV
ncbi:hypothetical protein J2X71_007216 [Rhizobium sp. 1399]|nr:hypothetical protein [Rhizobium sp. 1399]